MIPLFENKDELKKFLEHCEQAVEETGNTLNERGPLQRDHFRKIKLSALSALEHENTPVVILLSETAWTDIGLWDYQEQKGISDQIAGMKYCRSRYSKLFDTFNGNQLTSTTLWSFSGLSNLGDNPSQDVDISSITKLTLTYD